MSRFDPILRQLTLANQLTLLRLAAVPLIALSLLMGRVEIALVAFIAAAITDRLDGMAARRFGQMTALGAFLDPAADKLMMLTCYIVLALPDAPRPFPEFALDHHIPAWLTVLVVTRDIVIVTVAAGIYMHQGRTSFPPTLLGKWCTGWEMGNAGVFLLANVFAGVPDWLLRLGVVSTGLFVVGSGVQYLLRIGRQMRQE